MSNSSQPWSPKEATRYLAALEASGLSVAEFARQRDIPAQRLYWARRRSRTARPQTERTRPAFTELAVVEDSGAGDAPIELRLGSGMSIVLSRDFDEIALRRVLSLVSPC